MSRLRRWFKPPRRLQFTREGRWFCGIALGIGVAAVNTGNNLLYLVLGMMLSLIVASGVLSELALRGLEIDRVPPEGPFAGRPSLVGLTLRNGKRRFPSFSIEVEDLLEGRPAERRCHFLKIPAGRAQTASYRCLFRERGRHRFTGVRLSTRFPFALFRKSKEIESPSEIIVYPELLVTVSLPEPEVSPLGERPAARLGRAGDLFGVREYRPGDRLRDMHWRKTAQTGRPVVREHEDESGDRITLALDNGLPEGASARDRAALEREISRCAFRAKTYLARDQAVGLVTRGQAIRPATGPAQLHRILRCLALLEGVPATVPFARVERG
jgi:uncharacterized protein (DUF58 family)